MLHILYGPDSFSRTEAVSALKRGLDTDGMLVSNTNVLESKSLTLAQLMMVCDALPFLAAVRLVIVDGLLSRAGGARGGRRKAGAPPAANLPEEWKEFPAYLERMPPTTTLLLIDGEVPASSPLLAALAAHGRTRTFPKQPARALEGWIVQRAKAVRIRIEPAAVSALANSAPQDLAEDGQWHALWHLTADLEKLALFAGDRTITVDDVRQMVPAAAETNVFAWVDAVIERRGDEALRRLTDLLAAGQPPPVLLTMLTRGYRHLTLYADLASASTRPDEIARQLRMQPWLLDRLRAQASRYRLPRLIATYERILAADRSVKRGESDDTTALELLTAELSAAG